MQSEKVKFFQGSSHCMYCPHGMPTPSWPRGMNVSSKTGLTGEQQILLTNGREVFHC